MNNIILTDSTLRDGNHAVKQKLSLDEFISYSKNIDSIGIDILEVGHGNGLGGSSILVGETLYSDKMLLSACRENLKKTKLGIHVIPGFCTIKSNLNEAIDIGVDVFRVASHCTEADITKRHIEYLRGKQKTVFGVLMMSHMIDINGLVQEAKKLESYGAESVIIMDSAGTYLPIDVKNRIDSLVSSLSIPIGFHAHNNLGLAIANSLEAIASGASLLDGTIKGFGAGAGNAQLEILIALLQKIGYNINVDLYKLLDLVNASTNIFNPSISPISIISGLSGVFSGFAKKVELAASKFGVSSGDIFIELGKRNIVAGQENIIFEVAEELSNQKRKEEYHGF